MVSSTCGKESCCAWGVAVTTTEPTSFGCVADKKGVGKYSCVRLNTLALALSLALLTQRSRLLGYRRHPTGPTFHSRCSLAEAARSLGLHRPHTTLQASSGRQPRLENLETTFWCVAGKHSLLAPLHSQQVGKTRCVWLLCLYLI